MGNGWKSPKIQSKPVDFRLPSGYQLPFCHQCQYVATRTCQHFAISYGVNSFFAHTKALKIIRAGIEASFILKEVLLDQSRIVVSSLLFKKHNANMVPANDAYLCVCIYTYLHIHTYIYNVCIINYVPKHMPQQCFGVF